MSRKYCPVALDDEDSHPEYVEGTVIPRGPSLGLSYCVLFYVLLSVYVITIGSFGIGRSYWLPYKNLLKSQRMLPYCMRVTDAESPPWLTR